MNRTENDKEEWPGQHFVFTVDEAEIEHAAERLQARDVAVNGPVFIKRMPAKSLYFDDPDGHRLELCTPLQRA